MLKETGEVLCTGARVERQEELLSQRGRDVERSSDLPEDDVATEPRCCGIHAPVMGGRGRHRVKAREEDHELPWTRDVGAFSFSRVDTKGEVGCVRPEECTRVNLDINHIVRSRGQWNTIHRGILKTAY